MLGVVGTVQGKVILNCRRTGKGSSKIGINSGRNTQRNERMNEQGRRKKTRGKYKKIKKERKSRGRYAEIQKVQLYSEKKEKTHVS